MKHMPPVIASPQTNNQVFFRDLLASGYHIFSLNNVQVPDFYPSKFPNYPGVKLTELSIGDRITFRAFVRIGSEEPAKVDGGLIDLKVEHIDKTCINGVIVTKLPENFPLQTGSSLELNEDEIIYKVEITLQK